MNILPGPLAGNYKPHLLLFLRSCPCSRPKDTQGLHRFTSFFPTPRTSLLSLTLWVCQQPYICRSGSTFSTPCLPGCWPVLHHRFLSCMASSCFQPCPGSRGRGAVKSGFLFPWLPLRKVTWGPPCRLIEGHAVGKVVTPQDLLSFPCLSQPWGSNRLLCSPPPTPLEYFLLKTLLELASFEYAVFCWGPDTTKVTYIFIPCLRPVWPGAPANLIYNWNLEKEGWGEEKSPLSGCNLFESGASLLSAAPGDWCGEGVTGSTKEQSPVPCFKAVWGCLGMAGSPTKTKVGVGLDCTLICHLICLILLWKQNWGDELKIIFLNKHWD